MRRGVVIAVLAVLAFATIVIARLPASWVIPSRGGIACADTDGTVWSGTCSGLTIQGQAVGDVSWELHAVRILSGKAAAHFVASRAAIPGSVTRQGVSAQGDVEVGFGRNIVARNVQADFPLDPTLLPQLHLAYAGSVHADLALVHVSKGLLVEAQGVLEVHDLREIGGQGSQLGSYSLTFPGGAGQQVGHLRDLGGPLSVDGSLKITNEPGIDVEGLVKAQPTAPSGLQDALRILGSPDAEGRRQFAFSNAF